MTRMWMLDPRILCTNHLNGEHNELHKLVGSIRNHPHGDAIATGLVEDGYIDTTLINERHAALVEEMERRDWNHDSPLHYGEDEPTYGEGCISKLDNMYDLFDRCETCHERAKELSVEPNY